MARKQKVKEPEGQPAWLVTFSDMMTLMLTFFVLLVSMSVLDERRKLVVLGSIIGTFGVGKQGHDVLSKVDKKTSVEPGPMEMPSVNDLEPLRTMVWENMEDDLNFAANKFVQVFSIPDDVLFEPGGVQLKLRGRQILEAALPVFLQVRVPILLAGHSSTLRDEEAGSFRVENLEETMDSSWRLSFGRVMAVYGLLLDGGMDPEMLRVEAFGRFHPRHTASTAEGRRMNRRVDVILDKRNIQWQDHMGLLRSTKPMESFEYKDFIFRFENRGAQSAPLEH